MPEGSLQMLPEQASEECYTGPCTGSMLFLTSSSPTVQYERMQEFKKILHKVTIP